MTLTPKLCYLVRTDPPTLNVQLKDNGPLYKLPLTSGQLAGLVSEGARFLASEVRG